MPQIKISQLATGVPKGTDETPATDPTDTSQAASGTTKKYIRTDEFNYYAGLLGYTNVAPVRVTTFTSPLTVVYANGAAGVGATLTNAGVQAALVIDGVSLAVSDRVLVASQAAQLQNGVYTVTNIGSGATNWVMTRATDYDQPAEIIQGQLIPINQGTLYGGHSLQETGAGPWTIGVTSIIFGALNSFPVSPTNGGTGGSNPTAHGVLIAEGASPMTSLVLGAGQILIGTTASDPAVATLTPGTGISISSASGSITISSSGATTWIDQTTASVNMAVNAGYVANAGASLITFTLPAVAAIGDSIEILGLAAGLWSIVENAGQTMHLGNQPTTITTGSLSSTNQFDCIKLRCMTANTVWTVVSAVGNITVV